MPSDAGGQLPSDTGGQFASSTPVQDEQDQQHKDTREHCADTHSQRRVKRLNEAHTVEGNDVTRRTAPAAAVAISLLLPAVGFAVSLDAAIPALIIECCCVAAFAAFTALTAFTTFAAFAAFSGPVRL